MTDTSWVVGWAMFVWAFLIGAMLAFELYTVYWNRKHNGSGKRANLSAYISAFFQRGNRRLKYKAGSAILIAVFVVFLLHFLGYF